MIEAPAPEVLGALRDAGIETALIGAMAMLVHGVASRATADVDFMAVGEDALEETVWDSVRNAGFEVDIRRGDVFDPLTGVVRIEPWGEMPVDVVLFGSNGWHAEVLREAASRSLGNHVVRVVTPAGLVLLKLYAGGPRDLADVHALLDLQGASLQAEVADRVHALPDRARTLWERVLRDRD